MTRMASQKVITVDSRGRTSFAKVRGQAHDRYLVDELPNGVLILTPLAPVVSDAELAAIRDHVAGIEHLRSSRQG
jgi:hypothetical protein